MEPAGGGSSSTDPRGTYVLSNLAEVVERVFTFLPAKALLRVAGVCRLWRECVRRVLRTHRSVTWISAGVAEAGHLEGHCLVRVVAEALENVRILPRTVLYMADSETFISLEECRGHKRARKRTTMETACALEKLFPKQCQVLGIVTPGIVVTPMGSGSNRPQEIEIGESGFALLFPQIEGIKIQPFHFIKDPKNLTLERHQLTEVGLLDNPELRVVLVFGYNCCKVGASNYLHRVVSTFSNMNIILAGGQVDNLSSLTCENTAADFTVQISICYFSADVIRCCSQRNVQEEGFAWLIMAPEGQESNMAEKHISKLQTSSGIQLRAHIWIHEQETENALGIA